jgi:hypothetical protein
MSEHDGPMTGVSGHLPAAEGLARLRALWGPSPDKAEQERADAWARRALGVEPVPGDGELLADVVAETATKYGMHRRAS